MEWVRQLICKLILNQFHSTEQWSQTRSREESLLMTSQEDQPQPEKN